MKLFENGLISESGEFQFVPLKHLEDEVLESIEAEVMNLISTDEPSRPPEFQRFLFSLWGLVSSESNRRALRRQQELLGEIHELARKRRALLEE